MKPVIASALMMCFVGCGGHPKPQSDNWEAKYIREHDCTTFGHHDGYWRAESDGSSSWHQGWTYWNCVDGKGHYVDFIINDDGSIW